MPQQSQALFKGIQQNPAPKTKFTMSGIQLKITRYAKNQENMTCNQSTEIDPLMTEMMKLTNKDVKTAIIITR